MAISPCSSAVDEKGRELVVHGTVSFPIASYDDDILKNPVPWHWHEELEAGYITEGQIEIAVGSEKRILKPGDGFFVNTEVLHGAWAACSSACCLESFVFHPRLVGGGLDSIFWQKYLTPLLSSDSFKGCFLSPSEAADSALLSHIHEVWNFCEHAVPGYEFEVRTSLSHMIFLLSQKIMEAPAALPEKTLRDNARIKIMLQFIHDHYSEELNINQIAECAAISTSEALRCFKKTIGTTPIQYLKQYRIQKAAELLTSTTLKVADIGSLCGFQEMSYFAKTFREQKGMTPSEFRENH